MHGIIYRHIGRTGLGWIDGQKSPVFRRGKSGNPSLMFTTAFFFLAPHRLSMHSAEIRMFVLNTS